MNAPQTKNEKASPSIWVTAVRTPLLLLGVGLIIYGLLRWLAPNVNPSDFGNVIGLGALSGAALIELALRAWGRKGGGNGA